MIIDGGFLVFFFRGFYNFFATILSFFTMDWADALGQINPFFRSIVPNFPIVGDILYWFTFGVPVEAFRWVSYQVGGSFLAMLYLGLPVLGIIILIRLVSSFFSKS